MPLPGHRKDRGRMPIEGHEREATILGSVVLAAVVGWFAKWFLGRHMVTRLDAHIDRQTEREKAQQADIERLEARIEANEKLARDARADAEQAKRYWRQVTGELKSIAKARASFREHNPIGEDYLD